MMDENIKMSVNDIQKIRNATIINSVTIHPKGTSDDKLIKTAQKNGWIIVTQDIKMTIRCLTKSVPVIFVDNDIKETSYLEAKKLGKNKYKEMCNFIQEWFSYGKSGT